MFIAISILISLVVLGWVVYPLIRRSPEVEDNADFSNAELLKNQLTELENDLHQGLISADQFETAKLDLQKSFIDSVKQYQLSPRLVQRSPVLALAIVLIVPTTSFLIYDQVGTHPDNIQYMAEQMSKGSDANNANPHASGTGGIDVSAMVARVKQKAEADPDDLASWRMLARSLHIMQDYDGAIKAYKHLIDKGIHEAELYTRYADLLATQSGGINLNSDAYKWVLQALEIDQSHLQALWIAGSAAYYSKDYALAKNYWQKLLEQLQPGSDDFRSIEQNLKQIEVDMGQ